MEDLAKRRLITIISNHVARLDDIEQLMFSMYCSAVYGVDNISELGMESLCELMSEILEEKNSK